MAPGLFFLIRWLSCSLSIYRLYRDHGQAFRPPGDALCHCQRVRLDNEQESDSRSGCPVSSELPPVCRALQLLRFHLWLLAFAGNEETFALVTSLNGINSSGATLCSAKILPAVTMAIPCPMAS
jgi:hypothetical protein